MPSSASRIVPFRPAARRSPRGGRASRAGRRARRSGRWRCSAGGSWSADCRCSPRDASPMISARERLLQPREFPCKPSSSCPSRAPAPTTSSRCSRARRTSSRHGEIFKARRVELAQPELQALGGIAAEEVDSRDADPMAFVERACVPSRRRPRSSVSGSSRSRRSRTSPRPPRRAVVAVLAQAHSPSRSLAQNWTATLRAQQASVSTPHLPPATSPRPTPRSGGRRRQNARFEISSDAGGAGGRPYNRRHAFVHLRPTPNFPSSTAPTASTKSSRPRPRPTASPRWRITDLNNLFGAIKFYKAARGKGVKPMHRRRNLAGGPGADAAERSRRRMRAAGAGQAGLSQPVANCWRAPGRRTCSARQALGCKLGLAGGAERRADRAVGRRAGAGRAGAAAAATRRARAAEMALQLAAIFPHRFYIELQRAGRPDDEAHVRAAVQLAARLKLPVVATHPVQFAARPTTTRRTRRASASPKARSWATRAASAGSRASSTSSRRREMEELFADVPSRHRQHGRDRQALQPRCWSWASRSCRTSRRRVDGGRCRSTNTSASRRSRA